MSETDRCAIVGCGSKKRDLRDTDPVVISQLYTSTYFELKREYATQCCDRYYILSAKFGLVPPDKRVAASYDLTLTDLDEAAVNAWTERVGETLVQFNAATTLVVLAGQSYVDPLRGLFEECSAAVEYPFAATAGIGEQMGWLKTEITAAQNDPDAGEDTVTHEPGDDHPK